MFNIAGLFQWERFVTPSIIQIFFWLMLIIILLLGAAGIAAAVTVITVNLVQGLVMLFATLLVMVTSILFVRIAAEFVLMMFRVNEHLAAIRNRGEM